MRAILTIILFCLANTSFSQNALIDIERPISRIDVGYSIDGNLMFSIILNSNVNERSLQETSVNFKGIVQGQINWANTPTDLKKNSLKGVFQSSSNPFTYTADAKDGTTALVPKPSEVRWKSIEQVKLKFEIDGKYYELPYMTIYPPPTSEINDEFEVSVSSGKITGKQTGVVTVISDGTPFEVLSVSISGDSPKGKNTSVIETNALGKARFANSGSINLPVTTSFTLGNSTPYKVKAKVKKIGTEKVVDSKEAELIFSDEILIHILNKSPDYSLSVEDKDVIMDEVRTEGKGELGVEFVTKEYRDKIRIKKIPLGGGTYMFEYSGLSQLSNKSFSNFYYTVNGERLQQPYLMVKNAPVLSGFKFNGTKDDQLLLEFKLPQYVNKDHISISIIGKDKEDIEVKGSAIIKANESDNSKFKATLKSELTDLVARDTLLEVTLIVKYNNESLYSLGLTLFNQKILNEKVSELIAETANKPKKRDKEKIKKIVEDIVQIGKAVGNSIDDDDINSAIESLVTGDKEKIRNTMSDIGNWAQIAGKLILPLLI